MKLPLSTKENQRGTALVEMAITLAILLTVIFGVIEFSRLFWTINTLTEATRRGARYAVVNEENIEAVQHVVVCGLPDCDPSQPVAYGLNLEDVTPQYTDFNLGSGQITVSVNHQFTFAVPLVGTTVDLPTFTTTLTGESAGVPAPEPAP